MDSSGTPNIPVVVIACRVFENWLEHLLPEELTKDITFFDYALHEVPKKLRETLQNSIDSIEQPSLIVLGYGLCGNGLNDIQAGNIPCSFRAPTSALPSSWAHIKLISQEIDSGPSHLLPFKGWLEGGSSPFAKTS